MSGIADCTQKSGTMKKSEFVLYWSSCLSPDQDTLSIPGCPRVWESQARRWMVWMREDRYHSLGES